MRTRCDQVLQPGRGSIGLQAYPSKPITDLRNNSWRFGADLAEDGLNEERETLHLHNVALQPRSPHGILHKGLVGSYNYYPVKGVFSPRNKIVPRYII